MGDQDPGSDEGTDFLLADEAAAKGGHPAWQEILDAIPEEYRAAVTPTLEKWDKGVQNRFQNLHSKFEPLKAYEDLDPDQIAMGLNLLERINEDPRAVYDLMAQSYGFNNEQGVSENEESMSEQHESSVDPAVMAQLTETQQRLAQIEQERENARFQEELDAYIAYLHEPEPGQRRDFDEDYVITLLANGVDGEEAVSRYNKIVETAAPKSAPQSAPRIMSSGGGIPSNAIDPKTLSDNQAKDLVADMLRQAAES